MKNINLHFHDLRHEGTSRLLEAGWPLHHIQEMLGHASIEQTSTYLNVQHGGLRESMRKLEGIRSRCNPVVTEASIEHQTDYNTTTPTTDKSLIN